MPQSYKVRRALRDWQRMGGNDRLNATYRTPKQDRIADAVALLFRASIALGLWIIVLNQFFNLLTGD